MKSIASFAALVWRFFLFVTVHQWRAIDEAYRKDREKAEAEKRAQMELQDASETGAGKGKGKGKSKGKSKSKAKAKAAESADATKKSLFEKMPEYDWRPLIVLGIVAVSLTLQEYYGQRKTYQEFFPPDMTANQGYWHLWGFAWWSGWRVFGYIVIPVAVILMMRGERVRDYYISFKGFFKHLWIYVAMYAAFSPVIYLVSHDESFLRTYPFYKLANRSSFDLWAWEGLYAVQFLALEFFFRGFMLHSLGRTMGSKAIFVMIVPYCMIHYGKPLPETMGAILAGVVLGTLAMRTRSIWGGVLIHVGVAVTMDVLALEHCPDGETGRPCQGRLR